MKWSHRIAIGLLMAVIISGLNGIFFPPLRLSATMSTDQTPVLSSALPSYDPEVQELIETTYLGHVAEMPDPGEPAVVLKKYLEQNAHGYDQQIVRDEPRLNSEVAAWRNLVQQYPQSRHALAALAKHLRMKGIYTRDDALKQEAAETYLRAMDVGLQHGHVRYTRQLSELLVEVRDKKRLQQGFQRLLAQSQDPDETYVALVDYANGLAKLNDGQAWNYFEQAIALRPEDNEAAVNFYTEQLLDQGQAQQATQVLERFTTLEQRRKSSFQSLLHRRAADHAGIHSSTIETESASALKRLMAKPVGGYGTVSLLNSSSVDALDDKESADTDLATMTATASTDDSSAMFAWQPNGTIWEGTLFSTDSLLGEWLAFPSPPSGGVKKLVTVRLPYSGPTNRAGLFAIGTDNIVYYRYLNGSLWKKWQSLGVSAVDLTAVVWPNNQIDVFRVDTDRCNVYVSHSTDGKTWGPWNWWGACGDQIAVAVLPDSTAWAMLRTHFPAPYNIDVVVNRYFNGTSWANQWSLFPGALYGVNNIALQAHPTPLLGSIRMTFYTVDANNTTVYVRVSNGPAWSDQVFWTSGFKQVSSFDTMDGGFYLLYTGTSDSQLYTQRFAGGTWTGVTPQDFTWTGGIGAHYVDPTQTTDPPHYHTDPTDDCRAPNQTTCFPDPGNPGGCFFDYTLNLAEILYNEAYFEKWGARAMVGWTIRDRAFEALNGGTASGATCQPGTSSCLFGDSYVGAEGGAATTACRGAVPCDDLYYCDVNKRYCCVMHGGTTNIEKGTSQFDNTHVPFNTLYTSGFAYQAVDIINGWIPDPSTGFIPPGVKNCQSTTNCDSGLLLLCYSGKNLTAPDKSGPMEFLGYDYCAKIKAAPLAAVKWYAGDICGNTDSNNPTDGNPIEVSPHSSDCKKTDPRADGDNFFWSRVPRPQE
jgi:hypothetical protein